MFITIPKVFASMGMGTAVGVLFFVLVLFAALTSSIALTESAVSTFEDELGWDRTRSTILIGCIMITLGSLSALGYGPLASVTVFGMQFLDFFDFLTNSVMMPIAAIATCLLVSRIVGVEKIEEEVTREGQPFRRKPVFNFMLRYLCPIFAAIILASSVANALLDRDVTLFSARKKPPACILTGRGLFDHSFSNTRKRNAMSVVSSGRAARRLRHLAAFSSNRGSWRTAPPAARQAP